MQARPYFSFIQNLGHSPVSSTIDSKFLRPPKYPHLSMINCKHLVLTISWGTTLSEDLTKDVINMYWAIG